MGQVVSFSRTTILWDEDMQKMFRKQEIFMFDGSRRSCVVTK